MTDTRRIPHVLMFSPDTYQERRQKLCSDTRSGLIFLPGNRESSINFAHNVYPFRQDSSFLYFCGLDLPDLDLLIDTESGETVLYGDDLTVEQVIWTVPRDPLVDQAASVAIDQVQPASRLESRLKDASQKGQTIHFPPPYRKEHRLRISALLNIAPDEVAIQASESLTRAIIAQRSFKSPEELDEIETALRLSRSMHCLAMKHTEPGCREFEIKGIAEGHIAQYGARTSFPTILTVRGEILHNPWHGNTMKAGQMVIHDSGVESAYGYASDITRSFPVSGTFDSRQRDIYGIVLRSIEAATAAVKPGVLYRDVHRLASVVLLSGLKELGLVKGDPAEAVEAGVHTLFFPCGVGHMMGLDVHDMEALGEDWVGYTDEIQRNPAFGWRSLRLGKALEPNHVITVEPGIYFNPILTEQWKAENKGADFLDYPKIETFLDFGGVRLEDDVLVTDDGYEILGPEIPKSIEDVEACCGGTIPGLIS
ncbi:MAG: aminopeptidase P family protein [Verrucomicrobiota bacterium]